MPSQTATAARLPLPVAAEAAMKRHPWDLESTETAKLTRGLANGDDDAYRTFHQAYFDRLLRYLIVMTRGDVEAAQDALQETFLRVVRHAKRFESEDAFWSWLTVLARSAAFDGERKKQSYWRRLAEFARANISHAGRYPQSDTREQDLLELLKETIAELTPLERNLIDAKYIKRQSVRELAAQFQLSEKAIESRLSRSRRRLRETILKKLNDWR